MAIQEKSAGHCCKPAPSDFVLGVDLDGVCADFMGGLREIAAEWLDVPIDTLTETPTTNCPEWNITPEGFDALYRYAATRRDLFRSLRPVSGAAAALHRLWERERVRIRIITFRLYFEFFHRIAVDQTVDWLDKHDFPYYDLCFMKDKPAVGADLYIEDSARNVAELRRANQRVISFVTPQNLNPGPPRADNWTEVEELVLAEIEVWKERRALDP